MSVLSCVAFGAAVMGFGVGICNAIIDERKAAAYWQNSKGCLREMETAKKLGIHLREGLEAK